MDCPHCRVPLSMSERRGIEIDYCNRCRGVWLDRGELDKLLETSEASLAQPVRYREGEDGYGAYRKEDRNETHYRERPYKSSKSKSFLKELFDF